MWPLIIFTTILLGGYAFLLENYRRWFLKIKPFQASSNNAFVTFSVIIPARNEEANIEQCLQSVLNQNYPSTHFEVIVIDDHSTDNTAQIVKQLQQQFSNLHLINLNEFVNNSALNSYKKKAIALAIHQAKYDWIVTTDADCFVQKNWLATFSNFIQTTQPMFIAAPVKFINNGTFLSVFQCLDFITLQGITAASVHKNFHSMCNGANLVYNKDAFFQVSGFAGIDNIASGDDMLLMHKIYNKYPKQVKFLLSQEVITSTAPMPTLRQFLNQRIRWASKSDKYDDKRIFAVLVLVYFFNLIFLILPIATFWVDGVLLLWLSLLAGKTLFELRFLLPVARFFQEEKMLWLFPAMQPFHILYTIIAGWLGKFGTYKWKGRTVK